MQNAGQPRLAAGFDRHTGSRDGGRCRDAAEKRDQDIADALGHQFLIGVKFAAWLHAQGACTAQQALDHAESGY